MAEAPNWSEQAVDLVGRAVMAPSSHNSQPWFFLLGEPYVDLLADRTRALPVNDPDGRELTISCGCALLNLLLAAADRDFQVENRLLPDPEEPDWLSRVAITRDTAERVPEADLAQFIEERRTCRTRFESRAVEQEAVDAMVEAAAAEGAWLRPLVSDERRRRAVELVVEADALQWSDPEWRRELAAWMHTRSEGDGLTVSAFTAPVAQMVVRNFNMGGGVASKDRELAENSPLLAVLGTDGDGPRHWLAAGQALQRVLLVGCSFGLRASYLNQPIQIGSLRGQVSELVGGEGLPQILLRLGYAPYRLSPAPRRPLADVIEWS
ncbi:MAG: nitroreductase [Thioalkalivibrio sp.]|nr:MAG: nitroreductase [Thioalkalivibrio sp.]